MTRTTIYDGGPAFPRTASELTAGGTLADGNIAIHEQDGMSLRDWFAGQALAGILAAPADDTNGAAGPTARANADKAAAWAYQAADAMLAAREADHA